MRAAALFPRRDRHFNNLLRTARSVAEDQPEAAVAVAQMAFESFVGFAVVNLLKAHGVSDDLSAALAGCAGGSLMAAPERQAWEALSGLKLDGPATDGAYPRYRKHVERRNKAVHAGAPQTKAEAEESIDAVRALMTLLIAAARQRTDELLGEAEQA